jgi:riboflavin kinase
MRDKHIATLKQIALLGGVHDYIAISSRELGELLDISQQSASKKILELLSNGLIERDLGARRQRIKLTEKGFDLLRKEYSDYQRVFEMKDHLVIVGTVISGLGEGQYYVNQPEYLDQFQKKLWFKPYEGTLNIKVGESELPKIDILHKAEGIIVQGFEKEGRTFGDVKCFFAKIHNMECAVVMPNRSHYTNVLEIVCKYHLRRTLGLRDGDQVEIIISLSS